MSSFPVWPFPNGQNPVATVGGIEPSGYIIRSTTVMNSDGSISLGANFENATPGTYLYPGDTLVRTGGISLCALYVDGMDCTYAPVSFTVNSNHGSLPTDQVLLQWALEFTNWVLDWLGSNLPDPCQFMAIQGDDCTTYWEDDYIDTPIDSWISQGGDEAVGDWYSYDGYYDEMYCIGGGPDTGGCTDLSCSDPCYPDYCMD